MSAKYFRLGLNFSFFFYAAIKRNPTNSPQSRETPQLNQKLDRPKKITILLDQKIGPPRSSLPHLSHPRRASAPCGTLTKYFCTLVLKRYRRNFPVFCLIRVAQPPVDLDSHRSPASWLNYLLPKLYRTEVYLPRQSTGDSAVDNE